MPAGKGWLGKVADEAGVARSDEGGFEGLIARRSLADGVPREGARQIP
jgi:hypothetical protein